MSHRYETLVSRLRAAVLEGPATTPLSVRRAVEAYAAARSGAPPGQADGDVDAVPGAARSYVDTVARHAWKVTDEDVAGLLASGLSQDEVFEITVSAAVGAGLGRLARVHAAMRGDV